MLHIQRGTYSSPTKKVTAGKGIVIQQAPSDPAATVTNNLSQNN
jgi:hypothetical protein